MTVILVVLGYVALVAWVFCIVRSGARPMPSPPPQGTDARPPARLTPGSIGVADRHVAPITARAGLSLAPRAQVFLDDRRPGMSGPEAP